MFFNWILPMSGLIGFLQVSLVASQEEHWIKSPRVTNWGSWGENEYCSSGQVATGFQLKTETYQGGAAGQDDTALNGIRLYCNYPGQIEEDSPITSSVSQWGTWGKVFLCPEGFLDGFQLRSEQSQGGGDDTAANNLRMFCANGKDNGYLEGDGQTWGSWTDKQSCQPGQAICGLITQIEKPQGGGDDTALNNVDMKCCN